MALTLAQFKQQNPKFANVEDGELAQYLHQKYYSDEPFKDFAASIGYEDPNAEGDVSRQFKNTFRQIPQLGYGLLGVAGATAEHFAGEGGIASGVKDYAFGKYQEATQNLQDNSKPTDSLSYSWDQAKQGNLGALVDWFQGSVGYGLGQTVQMLAGAYIGQKAFQIGAEKLVPQLVNRMVADEAAKLTATEAAKGLTADAIQNAAVKAVTAKLGTMGAAGATGLAGYAMEGGEIGGGLLEKAEQEGRTLTGPEIEKGLRATFEAGSLEFLGDMLGLGALTGRIKIPGAMGTAARTAATGSLLGASEGGQEYGQTLIEEWGKGNDPFSDEARTQAIDAAGMGFVSGGGIGAVSGAMRGADKKTELGPIPAPQPTARPQDDIAASTAPIAAAQSVDDAIQAASTAVSAPVETWQQPSFKNIPDAEAIVRNRTIHGRGLLATIDSRLQDGGYNPLAGTWETPSATTVNEAIRDAEAQVNSATDGDERPIPVQNDGTETDVLRDTGAVGVYPQGENLADDVSFTPTHELSDGTPVTQIDGSTYRDSDGNEYQDDYATPIQRPTQSVRGDDRSGPAGDTGTTDRNGANVPGTQPEQVPSVDDRGSDVLGALSEYEQRVSAQEDDKKILNGNIRQFRENGQFDVIPPIAKEHLRISLELSDGLYKDKITPKDRLSQLKKKEELEDELARLGWTNDQIAANSFNKTVKEYRRDVDNGFIYEDAGLDVKRLAAIRKENNDTAPTNPTPTPPQPAPQDENPNQPGTAPVVAAEAQAGTVGANVEQNGLERGVVGGKYAAKQVILTASGRQTTPFPGPKLYKKVDSWLLENAALEAESRGDEFNSRIFREDLKQKIIPQASKDSAEEYLFGQQPELPRPFLKPLTNQQTHEQSTNPAAQEAPDEKTLIDHGLLREDPRSGRWLYKFNYDNNSWFTANRKEDAIERATEAFNAKPANERLTSAQKSEIADKERYENLDKLYGKKSIHELEQEYQRIDAQIKDLQKTGRREFTGNNTRRTSSAVSNEGARDLGQFKLNLQIYIEQRKQQEAHEQSSTPKNEAPQEESRAQPTTELIPGIPNAFVANQKIEIENDSGKKSKQNAATVIKELRQDIQDLRKFIDCVRAA